MALSSKSFGGRSRHLETCFELNLTPMIDTFVVLVIFLVKSYSTSPTYLTPTQDIELSPTTAEFGAPDKASLIIGKDGVILDGDVVVPFEDGEVPDSFKKLAYLDALKTRLDKVKADETKTAEAKNKKFSGTLILQADKSISFETLKPILRTAGISGFYDIKFAGQAE